MNRLVVASAAVLAIILLSSFTYASFLTGRTVTSGITGSATGSSSTSLRQGQSCGSHADWTTYHGNNSRSGHAASSATSASMNWRSQKLDGQVYAEPVVCGRNLIVATENDTVYDLNATSGALLWRTHLGTPMRGSALPCGNVDPSGITGTPVVDPVTGVAYVVAFETPGVHELVALSVKEGAVSFSRPADPPGADPLVQQERSALSLSGGMVYIPYGGLLGDCGDYHGWVVGFRADGSGGMLAYQVPSGREAGIWAPSGAAIGVSGDLFLATGNGASDSQFDYGNSVIELSPTLEQLGYFAPTNWLQLNQGDTDLGSVGPLFLGNGDVFQVGKEGVGYILNGTSLGGVGGELYSAQVCASAWGGDAYSGNLIFVSCSDGLFGVAVASNSFQVAWRSADFPAGPPIVVGGTVWTLDTGAGTLLGYAAATGAGLFSFDVGQATRFTTPSFGDGRVYVAAGDEVFAVLTG